MKKSVLGIVPARLASTRLPNKPLYPVLGRPLIEWAWRRVSGLTPLDHAVIATDSEQVAEVGRALGAPVEMTSPEHLSGTDRVAEVAARATYQCYDVIVNVQVDEPLLEERQLAAAVALVRDEGWEVGTCATPLLTEDARHDPAIVKVVRAATGGALYFSRAPIPHKGGGQEPVREELGHAPFLRHIGVYAYTPGALRSWVALPPSPLERLERLEQLRPLEGGLRIGVAVAGTADVGVDTPADVARLERRLIETGHTPTYAAR